MTTSVEDHLQAFRERNGEQAWRDEVRRLAIAALRTGSEDHRLFWKALTRDYDWLAWEELEQQASLEQPSADRLIVQALRAQMPGIRSQAQYDAVVGALEAARLVINALLDDSEPREQEARSALELAFEAVRKATELTSKLEDSPEAATSEAAKQFKQEPAQFREVEIQARLTQELQEIDSVEALNNWYLTTKALREKLVSKDVRNKLLDAIRVKRNSLTS